MILGVDTSNHNHPNGAVIDFRALAAAGDRFAILKATEGVGFIDAYFRGDRAAAHAAGLIVGIYHFARPGDPAAQARWFLSVVGALQVGEFIVVDDEDPAITPAWVKAFCDTVYAAATVKSLVYMNQNYRDTQNWSAVAADDDALWLAKYDGSTAMPTGGAWGSPAMKQYTSTGSAAGIAGPVDLDVFYGTDQQLLAYGLAGGDMPLTAADIALWLNSTAYTGGPSISQALKNLDQFAADVVRPDAPGGLVPLRQEIADAKTNTIKLVADVADVQSKLAALDPQAFAAAVVQAVQAMPAADAAQVADLVIAQLGQRINTPPPASA